MKQILANLDDTVAKLKEIKLQLKKCSHAYNGTLTINVSTRRMKLYMESQTHFIKIHLRYTEPLYKNKDRLAEMQGKQNFNGLQSGSIINAIIDDLNDMPADLLFMAIKTETEFTCYAPDKQETWNLKA